LDNVQKALVATLMDYAEAGLDIPGSQDIKVDMIFDTDFFQGEANKSSLLQTNSEKDLTQSHITKKVSDNGLPFRKKDLQWDLISNAVESANNAMDIKTLEESIINFTGFYSIKGSSGMVFATGNSAANVMVISEPPGRVEEIESVPYAGSAGELFKNIFAALELSLDGTKKSGLYVLPSVPFRLVRDFNSKVSDLDLIRPFLQRHIKIVSPRFLVLVGKIPGDILGLSDQFMGDEENGCIGFYEGIPAIEIEGMNSMIQSPEKKRRTWNNLKLLKNLMNEECQ